MEENLDPGVLKEVDGLEPPIEGGWPADLGPNGQVSPEEFWDFGRFLNVSSRRSKAARG